MTVRIGIVGAGAIGQLRARSVSEHPDTQVIGVVDPDQTRARAVAETSGARPFTSIDDLLAETPDAVFVASPLPDHPQSVKTALRAGAHVLCEKPLANTVEACRDMYHTATAADRILAVGFNHRYYPAIAYLKESVDAGLIGKLDHLRVFGGHDGLHNFKADWQYQAPASGGGAMMDVGIHMTDLARYIAGDLTHVTGFATNGVWGVEGSEDNAVAVFRGPDTVPVSYQATWTEWKGYRFYVEAYGTEGMVRGYYAPMFNMLVTRTAGGKRRRTFKLYPEVIVREKLKSWTDTAYRTFTQELDDFLNRISGGSGGRLATGWDGLRAVELAHAVYQSSATNQTVTLEPAP